MGYRAKDVGQIAQEQVDKRTAARRGAREHGDLTKAREIIRRHDKLLADYLDLVMPIPPCPHSPSKGYTTGQKVFQAPEYHCIGCGLKMRMTGMGHWTTAPPLKWSDLNGKVRNV